MFVPFRDSPALARAIGDLLDQPLEVARLNLAAHAYAQNMTWEKVARAHLDLARSLGVPLIPFEQVDRIHLTVDGADEAGPGGVLIKGGGAALLREKIIANASDHMVVIADPTKDVQAIGAFPLPVEVTPFGYTITAKKVHDALVAAGVERPRVELRKALRSNELLVTDGGNYILDCHCGLIPDPPKAAAFLSDVPGVVEHGLFIGIARTIIFGTETGARIIEY